MKTFFLSFLSILLLNASCNKEHLPEYYLRCNVNGNKYIPDNCANCLTAQILSDTTFILGGNTGFETLGIGINDHDGIKVGSYTLNGIMGRRGDYKFSTTPNDRYFTDSVRTGVLNITLLDRGNKIISGNFYYKAYNIVTDKTAEISEGKFRLQYYTN